MGSAGALLLAGAAWAQQPEQAHLSLTGELTELVLDFMAHDANCSIGWGASIGTSPDLTDAEFVPAFACDDFSYRESLRTYAVRVLFQGLVPGTTYYYVCGSPNLNEPWSQVFSFVHASGSVRPGGPVYAVLADFGYYNAESLGKLIEYSELGAFDVLIHAGDFAYDLDSDTGGVGDGYMRALQPVTASVPYMGIPGNHEHDGGNFTNFRVRFAGIGEGAGARSGSNTSMWYSFVDGLTHWCMWDSEVFWASPVEYQTAMMAWLGEDLAAANDARSSVPWLIGVAHKAWWMDDTLQCPLGPGCAVWKALSEAGADVHIVGHIHYYARDYPEYPCAGNGSGVVDRASSRGNTGNASNPVETYVDPAYMVTLVCAAPGDQEVNRRLAASAPRVGAGQASATSTNNYGFALLTVLNTTHLHWRFETAVPHVNSSAPGYTDDFTLIVNSHGPRGNLPPV